MKKLFLGLAVLFMCFWTTTHAQFSVTDLTNYTSPPKSWEVCSEDTFTFSITTPASFVAGDSIWITTTLPLGVEAGTLQMITPVATGTITGYDLTTSTPSYSIVIPASGSQTFVLELSYKAACELFVQNSTPSFPINFDHYSGGSLITSLNTTTPSILVSGGQLNLLQTFNEDFNQGQFGVPFPRCFTYQNTGNLPYSGTFTFTDTLEFPTSQSSVQFTGITVSYLNSGSTFSVTVDNDSVVSVTINVVNLMPDDSIVICDTAELIACPSGPLNTSVTWYNVQYGCPGAGEPQCINLPQTQGANFTQSAFDPADRPDLTYRNLNPTILCPATPDQRKYAFINFKSSTPYTGVASGMDIQIRKFNTGGTNQISYVDTSTISIYKIVGGIPVNIPFFYTSITNDGSTVTAGYPFIINIHFDEYIPHGDTIFLEFLEEKLCIDSADYGTYFNSATMMDHLQIRARFTHPCFPTGYQFRDLSKTLWNEPSQRFALGQFFNNLTGTVVDQQEIWMNVTNTTRLFMNDNHPYFQSETYVDSGKFGIEVELQLDSGLCLVGDSIYLKGFTAPTVDLYPTSVTVIPGDGTNLGTKDRVIARFRLPGNFFSPNSITANGHYFYGALFRLSADYFNFFNNFATTFKVKAKCDYSPPGGLAKMTQNFFAIYDTTCSPECKFPLASVTDQVQINCPGCYLPGWNLSDFKVERINLGGADDDNNNYPDVSPYTSNPPANPLLAHKERVMVNDTLSCHIEAFTSDGENLLFNNIGFDYVYGQLVLNGPLMDNLQFLGATGTYFNGVSSQTFTIPSSAGFINPTGQFYIMLDTSDWVTYGLPSGFLTKYDFPQTVEFDMLFRVKDNLNSGSGPDPYFSIEAINGFIYMSGTDFSPSATGAKVDALTIPQVDIENPALYDTTALANLLYWCTGWEGRIVTIGADFSASTAQRDWWGRIGYGAETDPCLKTFEFTGNCSVGQSVGNLASTTPLQSGLNSFSFELRNLWQLDSIDFTIPGPYEIERIELRYQTMQLNGSGSATVIPCGPNNYSWTDYPISDTVWVNDTTIRIYPWAQLQNITGPLGCTGNTSLFDETKIIRIRPILKMRDCATTPKSYTFTNYPMVSYWNAFPLSTTNDTIITRNVSGTFEKPYLDWYTQVLNVSNSTPGTDLAWTINVSSNNPNTPEVASNTPSPSVNNAFFWFGPANGNINITSVQWGTSPPVPVVGTHNGLPIYGLGKVGTGVYNGSFGGRSGPVNITADYDCSSYNGPDSLMLIFGDNCYNYPDTLLPSEVCFMDTVYLLIPQDQPGLQFNQFFPTTLSGCDTTNFKLELSASDTGSVENVTVTMTTNSPGIQYVSGSGIFSFDGDSSQVDPIGNTFPLDTISYFNGSFNGFKPSAFLDFQLASFCDYDGSPVDFEITATNYCGDTIGPFNFSYTPSFIDLGTDLDSLVISSMQADSLLGCRDSSLIQIDVLNTGTGPSTLNDTLWLELPNGMTYLSGTQFSNYNGQDINFGLNNIPAGSTETISFWVGIDSTLNCGQYNIPIELSGFANILCDSLDCSSSQLIEGDTLDIYFEKSFPDITSMDLFGLCHGDSIVVNLTNTSGISTGGFQVEYYCVSNETGPLSTPCLLGTSSTYTLSPFGTLQATTSITPSCSDCNQVMAVIQDSSGCICSSDTLFTSIDCDTVYYADASFIASHDTVCSGDLVTFTSNYTGGTHFWQLDNQTTSTNINPQHMYSSIGNVQVMHVVSDGPLSDTAYTYIHVLNCDSSNVPCCTDSSLIDPLITCPDTWEPVCGCDGNTYVNSCFAENVYGIGVWRNGPCSGTCNLQASYTTNYNGMSITFTNTSTGTPGYTSTWDFGDGDTSTAQNPVHLYTTPGTYLVTLTVEDPNDSTCFSIYCDSVIITPCFLIMGLPQPQTICEGTCTNLNVIAGTTNGAYIWTPTTGLSDPTIPNPVACPTSTTTYTINVVDTLTGCTGTTTALVNVLPAPTATSTLNLTVCESSPSIFIGWEYLPIGYTSTPWFTPSPGTGGDINTTGLAITNYFGLFDVYFFDPSTAGPGTHTIEYVYTDPATGCTDTAIGTIVVNPDPDVIILGDSIICPGTNTTLYAVVTNSSPGPYTYNWSNSSTVDSTVVSVPGTYTVTVTDSNGCTGTATFILNQYPQSPLSITTSNGTNQACVGDPFTLTATGGYTNYNWYNNADPTTSLGNMQTFSPDSSGTYCVTAIDSNGCQLKPECITITINPLPVVTATTPVLDMCESDNPIFIGWEYLPLNFTNTTWFTPTGFGGDIDPTGLTVNLVFGVFEVYSFDPSIAGPGSHTITYTFTDPVTGCSDSTVMTINVFANPVVAITGDTLICPGDSTTLTANVTGTSPFTYNWSTLDITQSTNVNLPGTYSVTVTDANGCTGTASVNVMYFPQSPMVITTSNGTNEACEGDNFTLTATGGYTNYNWYNNADPTTSLGNMQTFSPDSSGIYCVTAIDSNGCEIKPECINITIHPLPVVTANTPVLDLCITDAPEFIGWEYLPLNFTNTPWFTPIGFGGDIDPTGLSITNIFGVFDVYFFDPSIAGVGSHTITYTFTDPNTGCSDTATMTINVLGAPVSSITPLPDIDICTYNGIPIPVTINTTPGSTCTLSGPGIDPISNTFDPVAAGGVGSYTITLICSNSCGSDTSSITVSVYDGSWHQTTLNTNTADQYNDVTTDSDGNVYVVGTFIFETTLDGGGNPDITINSVFPNFEATFLAKYDPCGDLLWVAHSSNAKTNTGESIIVDEANDVVYITGTFSTNVQFNSSISSAGLCTTGFSQTITGGPATNGGYVAQYDRNTGCLHYVEDISGGISVWPAALAINENTGDIYVGGRSPFPYVRKYQPTIGVGGTLGGIIWDITSTGGPAVLNDLDYDEVNDRIWGIGSFARSNFFTPGPGNIFGNPSPTVLDAFMIGYNDLGTSTTLFDIRKGNVPMTGTNVNMTGEGIAVDDVTGNPCVTGTYINNVTQPFQFTAINPLTNNLTDNAYMICLDMTTMSGWSRSAEAGSRRAGGFAVDTYGPTVYFTGNFQDDVTIDLMPANPYLYVGGPLFTRTRVYAASYDIVSGAGGWANVTESPSTGGHTPFSIATDNNNHLFIVGAYEGTMSYYSGVPSSGPLSSSGAGNNSFVLRGQLPNGEFRSSDVITSVTFETEGNRKFTAKVMPNPTTGITELVIEGLPDDVQPDLNIRDLTGKSVYTAKLTGSRTRLDLSNFRSGTYFVTVTYNGYPVTLKVVKIQ